MNEQKMNQEVVRAAGLVIMAGPHTEPSVLLMRHANRWDFPKGHCEPGESFLETAIRETEEETGISPNLLHVEDAFQFDLKYDVTYRRWGNQVFEKQVRYFFARVEQPPEIVLTEHEGFQWIPWAPPHQIQTQTIDSVLTALHEYLQGTTGNG